MGDRKNSGLIRKYRKNKYLVKWKEYTQDDIWEPEENLQNTGKKLQEYLQSLPKTRSLLNRA